MPLQACVQACVSGCVAPPACREDEEILTEYIKSRNLTLVTNAVTHSKPVDHPRGDASTYTE